jgi:hypothetical protein
MNFKVCKNDHYDGSLLFEIRKVLEIVSRISEVALSSLSRSSSDAFVSGIFALIEICRIIFSFFCKICSL